MELEIIKNKIIEIRGCKVLIDVDLAKLYEVETRVLKQAVKRNIDRFPKDFMFELNIEETQILVSQNVIPTINHLGGAIPFAFTEQGIAMLSTVLKSKKAIQINISTMCAFALMRRWAMNQKELSDRVDSLEQQFGKKFTDIEQVLNFLIQKEKKSSQQAQRKNVGYK